jgi:P-type E1-E2 ATPase
MEGEGVIAIPVPGADALEISHVVFDLNGTLARDGELDAALVAPLRRLTVAVTGVLASADTNGTMACVAEELGLAAHRVATGADKARIVAELRRGGASGIAAIGNGNNDVAMFGAADLAIAVLGPEGTAVAALKAADILASSATDAVDLLLHPLRLVATLRP